MANFVRTYLCWRMNCIMEIIYGVIRLECEDVNKNPLVRTHNSCTLYIQYARTSAKPKNLNICSFQEKASLHWACTHVKWWSRKVWKGFEKKVSKLFPSSACRFDEFSSWHEKEISYFIEWFWEFEKMFVVQVGTWVFLSEIRIL